MTVKTLSIMNLAASRYIKEENASHPVGVSQSKTRGGHLGIFFLRFFKTTVAYSNRYDPTTLVPLVGASIVEIACVAGAWK